MQYQLLYFSSVNFVFSCLIIFQTIIASGVVLCYQLIHCTLQRMHPSSPHCNWWPSCQCWQCHHHCGTANTTTARNVHLDLHQYFHLQWYKVHIEALLPAISLCSISLRAIIGYLTSSGRLASSSPAAWTFSPWTSARDSSSVATSAWNIYCG